MRLRDLSLRSLRFLPAACALFMGLNGQAATPEAPHGVAAAFGNTVKALYPDGRYQRIWIRSDGTWEALGRRGGWSSGRWTQKNEKLCLKQSRPIPAPFSYCTAFPSDGSVGVQWASKDMRGVPIQLTLVPGIDRP